MVDLTPFKAKIDEIIKAQPKEICKDPRGALISHLNSLGFVGVTNIVIGKFGRHDTPDCKRGKKTGWYRYEEIEARDGEIIGVAGIGDWVTGYSEHWSSRTESQMGDKERIAFRIARDNLKAIQDKEEKERQGKAAEKAYSIWSNAPDATDHGYLSKKNVKAVQGVKLGNNGMLIIPIAVDNQITSLQFIGENSEKRFLTNGRIKGGWFMMEGSADTIYIAEGYSTAYTVHAATGATVYVAFNAGNLYEVTSFVKTKHKGARIIIAGDDDKESKSNVGRSKAEQAATGLNVECVFPIGVTDFNDMEASMGLGAVKSLLTPSKKEAFKSPVKIDKEAKSMRPAGVLGDIFDYYNATSGNKQHGFAIQAGLAITGLILARSYRTNLNNWPNLYLLNVAKSGTGKEHAKTVFEKVIRECGLVSRLAGDGYTSAGAVFSELLRKPTHGTSIDEFGRYLEAGRSMDGGNKHQREANTKLMEAITRSDGVMRPPTYSTMTLKKADAKEVQDRLIQNPAITLLTMTTPSTLFKTLDMGAVKDGFINRFIISVSDAKRELRVHKPPMDVPQSIIDWANEVVGRYGKTHISTEPAAPVVIPFTPDAHAEQEKFQRECLDLANKLEKYGMDELTVRANEMAMKVSLVHALSRDPHTEEVTKEDFIWASNYIKGHMDKTISILKITLSHSEYEADKKEVLASIRDIGEKGITRSAMNKTPPYSKHKRRDLDEILEALLDAELVAKEQYQPPKGGRPTLKWIALN